MLDCFKQKQNKKNPQNNSINTKLYQKKKEHFLKNICEQDYLK